MIRDWAWTRPCYLAAQPDGNILLGGAFTEYNGSSCNGYARITSTGFIDPNLAPGSGADGVVRAIALQPDNEILIGGYFTTINQTRRVGIARLYTNGTVSCWVSWIPRSTSSPA